MDTLFPMVEELTWKNAKKYAEKGCKELCKILDDIDPPDQYTLLRVRYPFGSIIMHDDSVYIPLNGNNSVSLSNPEIPQKIKDKIGYRSIPFGMITKNPIEVYRETSDRIFSVELSDPNKGIELGIFEYFGLTPCYTVSAGARSLFMIPKISETRHHNKLMKQYQINCIQPRNPFKHWCVFRELYNSEKFSQTWESEILFFTKPWDDGLKKEKKSFAWAKLENYLYKKGFEHSELGRRKLLLDILWQKISVTLEASGFKPDIYIIDTLKQLIYIFLGGISGSRPLINDHAAPILQLQKIYAEEYGLNEIPTIMGPHRFSYEKNIPVYYSMQLPTMISSNPSFRKVKTIIEDMRELIMAKSMLAQNEGNIKINNTKLHELVRNMKLEFFHGKLYSYGTEIRPTIELPKSDTDFLHNPTKKNTLKFSDNGSFIRGCVKISHY